MPYFLRTQCGVFWSLQAAPNANCDTHQPFNVPASGASKLWVKADGMAMPALPFEPTTARVFEANSLATISERTIARAVNFHSEDTLKTGWLSPEGAYFPVRYGSHIPFINDVLDKQADELAGWISVHDDFWCLIEKSGKKTGIITQAQHDTLTRIGRNPADPHATPDHRVKFETAMPDWAARKAALDDAHEKKFEMVITGARELTLDEKIALQDELRGITARTPLATKTHMPVSVAKPVSDNALRPV